MAAAQNGDTVCVSAGHYREALRVWGKSVDLVGEGSMQVSPFPTFSLFHVCFRSGHPTSSLTGTDTNTHSHAHAHGHAQHTDMFRERQGRCSDTTRQIRLQVCTDPLSLPFFPSPGAPHRGRGGQSCRVCRNGGKLKDPKPDVAGVCISGHRCWGGGTRHRGLERERVERDGVSCISPSLSPAFLPTKRASFAAPKKLLCLTSEPWRVS